jgi:hypothetical protein
MVIYSPLGFVWVYYAIKARAFWFFSPVNPTLEFSGFEGESKKEMYEQLPKSYYPKTIFVTHDRNTGELIEQVWLEGFSYPVIAKPQIGMQGILVRKLKNEQQLKDYHIHIPVDYIIQDFVDLPLEFSVFHIRYPGQTKGKVTGFILKEYIEVTGDGSSTLLHLIQHHPKAKYREEEMRHLHEENLFNVIPAGQKYMLSFTGNHNRGARFINLHNQIDQKLCDVFDKISNQAGQFYFGRYDLKCTSIEDLKEGKNISILEYNGAGAEPNHIYDCGMSYLNALKEVVRHWEDLYRIGRINFKNGVPYWNFMQGKRQMDKSRRFFKMLRKYDLEY